MQPTFSECFLCARNFLWNILFNLHKTPMKQLLLLPPVLQSDSALDFSPYP